MGNTCFVHKITPLSPTFITPRAKRHSFIAVSLRLCEQIRRDSIAADTVRNYISNYPGQEILVDQISHAHNIDEVSF